MCMRSRAKPARDLTCLCVPLRAPLRSRPRSSPPFLRSLPLLLPPSPPPSLSLSLFALVRRFPLCPFPRPPLKRRAVSSRAGRTHSRPNGRRRGHKPISFSPSPLSCQSGGLASPPPAVYLGRLEECLLPTLPPALPSLLACPLTAGGASRFALDVPSGRALEAPPSDPPLSCALRMRPAAAQRIDVLRVSFALPPFPFSSPTLRVPLVSTRPRPRHTFPRLSPSPCLALLGRFHSSWSLRAAPPSAPLSPPLFRPSTCPASLPSSLPRESGSPFAPDAGRPLPR